MPKSKSTKGLRLSDAIANGDRTMIGQQIRDGADINARNDNGETLLSFAAAWNQVEIAEMLLNAGADPNVAEKRGETALMLAAQHGSPALFKLLLKHNADPRAADLAGFTVAMHADWRDDDYSSQIKRLLSTALCKKKSHAFF